ncbi:MAG TPA: VWA domain-containing protein [Lysobacter sp.]
MSFAAVIDGVSQLHLLRPQWLWALLALPLLAWLWRARRRNNNAWREWVDPHLLRHLLDASPDRRSRFAGWLGALGYALAVLALAGPSWRQVEQPRWQTSAPLVIALDLSSASLAADLPPSRLAQARAKLAALLRERKDGQVGLVVFAGDAFTVAPLTDDAANVALFLDALQPDVMPVDGQRSDRAIAWSTQLLKRAGASGIAGGGGEILLLTDHADAEALKAAEQAAGEGYRVSVLGLGSEAGAPYRRPDGAIVGAQLDSASLRKLAARGNGRYAALAAGDDDLRDLGVLDPAATAGMTTTGEAGRSWQDEGYWLLPPLLLLALFAFRRRGMAMALLLACIWMPWQPAQAAGWWVRPDQAAHRQMEQGTRAYRQGDFARAAQAYQSIDSADGHYNRGNALAKAGQYPQAIDAYDQALSRQPQMADAIANKRAVEAAMKRKPPQGPKSGQQNPKQGGQGGQPNSQSGQGQRSKPQSGGTSPQQSAQQSPSDASQQDGKPQDAELADAQSQRDADAAQRERMQRALQAAGNRSDGKDERELERSETPAQRERRLANEAWLKRVPDDPGGLLRAKFKLEYERRLTQGAPEK